MWGVILVVNNLQIVFSDERDKLRNAEEVEEEEESDLGEEEEEEEEGSDEGSSSLVLFFNSFNSLKFPNLLLLKVFKKNSEFIY